MESDTGSEQAEGGEASIDTDHDEPISDFELEDPQEMCQGLYAIADSESDYEVVDSKTFGFLCAAFKRGELDWSTYCNAPRGKGPDKLTQPDKHAAWMNLVLRGFLGAVGWFRLWISDFAKIQAPLNELLKGTSGENRKFGSGEWKDYHQKAFLKLKKALVSFPILSVFDPARPTELIVDASETHLGAALIQRMPDGKPVVIAYWSRALNDAEKKYSSQEREMLAICKACTTFRHYIMGAHLTVRIFSDHKSLKYIERRMLGSASNDTVPLLLTLALGCLLGPLLLAHAVHRRKGRHLRRVGRQREVSRYLNTQPAKA